MGALTFDDLTPNAALTAVPDGVGADGVTRITVRPQATTSAALTFDDLAPAKTSPVQQLAIDFNNQQSAAGQGTTPNVAAQHPNLLSTDVYESDGGDVLFKDKTGNVVPTDKSKHVVLRDPSDNRLKVFSRTPGTDEGRLSSAGRLLMTGMVSGAPTLRASTSAAAPTIEALQDASKAAYASPEIAALEVKASALENFGTKARVDLNELGIDDNLAPKTFGVLGKTEGAPEGAVVTGKNIDSLRRTLSTAAGSNDPTERKAASQAIKAVDEFLSSLPKEEVLLGNPQDVSKVVEGARGNYAAAARSQKIVDALKTAEDNAGKANSGQNIDNATRAQIHAIVKSRSLRARIFSAPNLIK